MNVGVLGGGRMGAGIAHAFLMTGNDVVVIERDEELADAAASRIHESVARSLTRCAAPQPQTTQKQAPQQPTPQQPTAEQLTKKLHVGTDFALFADRDLAIEAVPEDRALKGDALTRVERVLARDAVLASNTSSISIDDLATSLTRPERFLGLHFFNPVPSSTLVEVVTGSATDADVIERARGWVEMLTKAAIIVRDSPGFASSRLGVALALESIRMLETGVASAEDIDRAMELGYRHPMGPLRTTDVVGLDVRLGIAEELHANLGARFEPPALLRRLVAEGKLGRKSGEGFYRWDNR